MGRVCPDCRGMTALEIRHGNCLDVLAVAALAGERYHAVVTDPPYHLTSIQDRFGKTGSAPAKHGKDGSFARLSKGFMGKTWDGGDVAFRPETWRLVWDVLYPGAHMAVFGGTRTFHRMAVAIEDAGFELRDTFFWLYGTGFPKSRNISRDIDKALGQTGTFGAPKSAAHAGWIARGALRGDEGHEGYQRPWMDDPEAVENAARQYIPATEEAAEWLGWGTAVKPGYEPIVVFRKPLDGTVAVNVLKHGCGGLNIDGCRVPAEDKTPAPVGQYGGSAIGPTGHSGVRDGSADSLGRWPTNLLHDGSPEVLEAFGHFGSRPGQMGPARNDGKLQTSVALGNKRARSLSPTPRGDSGSAARFFPALGFTDEDIRFHYSGKATKAERMGSQHPTIKPIDLLRWISRLITPQGGRVLDPFAGTGTAGYAAQAEGFSYTGIEMTDEYVEDCIRRLPEATVDRGPWGLDLLDALARNKAAREALCRAVP